MSISLCVIIWIIFLLLKSSLCGNCTGNNGNNGQNPCCGNVACVCGDLPTINGSGYFKLINGTNGTQAFLNCTTQLFYSLVIICIKNGNDVGWNYTGTIYCNDSDAITAQTPSSMQPTSTLTSSATDLTASTAPDSSSGSATVLPSAASASPAISIAPSNTANSKGRGKETVVAVAVPLGIIICALAVVLFILLRKQINDGNMCMRYHRNVHTELGLSITNNSYDDKDAVIINPMTNGDPIDTEYAEIQPGEMSEDKIRDSVNEYPAMYDVPSGSNETVEQSHNKMNLQGNFSKEYAQLLQKKETKTQTFNYSNDSHATAFKGRSSLTDLKSFDSLEVTIIPTRPNKLEEREKLADRVTDYTHVQSDKAISSKPNVDEYSHLDYRPTAAEANSKEIKKVVGNGTLSDNSNYRRTDDESGGYEVAEELRHDYLELLPSLMIMESVAEQYCQPP